MAFLEPLLELLRLQQCYQSVHGFGSLHLLSQDEKKMNIKMNIMIMMMMMVVVVVLMLMLMFFHLIVSF